MKKNSPHNNRCSLENAKTVFVISSCPEQSVYNIINALLRSVCVCGDAVSGVYGDDFSAAASDEQHPVYAFT